MKVSSHGKPHRLGPEHHDNTAALREERHQLLPWPPEVIVIHNLKQAEIQVPSSWSEHANELRGIMDTIKDHTDHIESTRGSAARIRVIVVSTLFEVPMEIGRASCRER